MLQQVQLGRQHLCLKTLLSLVMTNLMPQVKSPEPCSLGSLMLNLCYLIVINWKHGRQFLSSSFKDFKLLHCPLRTWSGQ